jgi:hypothetical protein
MYSRSAAVNSSSLRVNGLKRASALLTTDNKQLLTGKQSQKQSAQASEAPQEGQVFRIPHSGLVFFALLDPRQGLTGGFMHNGRINQTKSNTGD